MIKPGFIALHGNRLELLAETLFAWLDRHPLSTLEKEIVLTPSHALAEWIKMQMAQEWGICAVTQVELPGRVLWGFYRKVLERTFTKDFSPTDREVLIWRVFRLMNQHLELKEFSQIKAFLENSSSLSHYEMARSIADLFDQYQVYRGDWLRAWSQGQDVLVDLQAKTTPLAEDQRWQAMMWRFILSELSDEQALEIRPNLHGKVMEQLNTMQSLGASFPKRLVLFGFSTLPQQVLEFLSALSNHVQVILCINSPCRFHWADITSGRELLASSRQRLKNKNQIRLSDVNLQDMHVHANPLLANWGRQSRDFIRLLDRFDSFESSSQNFDQMKVDVFDSEEAGRGTFLEFIQHQIRDLQPVQQSQFDWEKRCEQGQQQSTASDGSVVFHVAHGMTRELEVLHDQLLQMLSKESTQSMGLSRLEPKDIVVMMPDIESAASKIEAIFGQYDKSDSRFIPFGISDVVHLANHPLVNLMQWLCQIRSQKVGLSEVIEITRLTVVAKRFGFDAEDLEILESWLTESGARWGLNVSHRKDLGFEVCGHTNTLLFGLQRMVLGYLSGSYDSQPIENQDQTWIQPHSRVEGLDAQVVGHFAMLLDALIEWWSIAANAKTAQEWAGAFSELISQWIEPENSQDVSVQMALRKALDDFILSIDAAQYDGVLELEVAAKVWFEILKLPPKRQRLRASGVTFCTMKTMRSIPFKVICLIGLNEGDFPKSTVIQPFDLMKMTGQMRAGDRSHKEDDRALMLEALLSARQTLYISWSGFGIRDNSYQSPSVLVTQFRQYIRAIGGDEQLKKMTTTHPAQPFGRSYFDQASTQWTFAKEWEILYAKPGLVTSDLDRTKVETPSADLNRVLSQLSGQTDSSECLHSHSNTVPVALKDLFAFIKNPSKYYFRHELRINFDDIENNLMDSEPLSLKGLELYAIKDEIMRSGLDEKKRNDIEQAFRQKTVQLSAQGRLGMGQLAQGLMQDTVLSLMAPVSEYWRLEHDASAVQKQVSLSWRDAAGVILLQDGIQMHYPQDEHESPMVLRVSASRLFTKRKIKLGHLLEPWLTSIFLSACESQARVKWIYSDAVVSVNALDCDQSSQSLRKLLCAYNLGQTLVLPLPFQTALAYVMGESLENAKKAYEGSKFDGGNDFAELQDPCWAREYSSFDDLMKVPNLTALWKQLYQPLLEWSQTNIDIQEFQKT